MRRNLHQWVWVFGLSWMLASGLAAQEKAPEKPAEGKPADAKAPEAKPAETKPAETKPAEVKPPEAKPAEAPAAGGPAEQFKTLLEEWKALLADLRKLRTQFATASEADQTTIKDQWNKLIDKGNGLLPKLRDTGKAAFIAAPNTDIQLTKFLVKLAADAADNDQYEACLDLSEALIKNNCDDKSIFDSAGRAAFCINDFAKAADYFKQAQAAGALSVTGQEYESQVAAEVEAWKNEQKIREAEAQADDLPRVRLKTSQGEILIELFENDAPDTVGNFISLVEKKYYDGLSFHRVLKGFMAQGGCPKGDGSGGPGYQIFCELDKPEYRRHFRGSLSMAHAGKDTGGSQFFLTFRPTPHLDNRHTCFGRVVQGLDVLEKITRRDPQAPNPPTPDKILSAVVERKRDHAYAPKKVE